MTSLTTGLVRLVQLRRRYAVIGLFVCFTVCLFIYSAIPTRHHDFERVIIRHPPNREASRVHREGTINAVKVWLSTHVGNAASGMEKVTKLIVSKDMKVKDTKAVKKVEMESRPRAVAKVVSTKAEALASKKKLDGGVEVFSGNLGQVVLVPFAFNVSAERVSRLADNTMLFKQLQKQVRDTRAYLASVQPDFDINAGACRCGSSISTGCACCAKLTMKRFLMESPACVNFTYVLKDRVLRVGLSYHRHRMAQRTLAAATPPMLCAGGSIDLCAAFRNVTYKVQLDSVDHKTSLSGCLDLMMRLKARPIAIYPMGCFRMGRDPKLVHIDKMNNWMP